MYFPTLKNWSPFRIDALGLVTILGVDELNLALGRLVRNRYTEYLPLLGGFIIAQDRIVKPLPGFIAYNVTDGIMATDVAGYFSRWLSCSKVTYSLTTLNISCDQSSTSKTEQAKGVVLGAIALLPTLAITALAGVIGDWWGFANAISMLLSVIVRRIIVGENRAVLDAYAEKAVAKSIDQVKTFWTMPDGRTVIINLPKKILTDCLLTTPRPRKPVLYNLTKIIGWIAFGCHVITLGMATLFIQILSVALLLVASVLVSRRIGDDDDRIGSRLSIDYKHGKEWEARAAAYGRLKLTTKEEDSMIAWALMPQRSNESWWDNFQQCKEPGIGFDDWGSRMERAADAARLKNTIPGEEVLTAEKEVA